MKARGILAAGLAAVALAAAAAAQDVVPIDGSSFDGNGMTLNWRSDPDAVYRVTGTTSLTDPGKAWKQEGGYVSGGGWTLGTTLDTGTNTVMFFRVEKVDQEGPSFEFLSPAKDAVSVGADDPVRIAVSDASGVSDRDLAVYVGQKMHLFGADPDVSWEGGVLSYTGGALGNPGETVEVWATATDNRGNTAASESSLLLIASAPETLSAEEGAQAPPFVVIGAGGESVSELVDKVAEATGFARASVASAEPEGTLEITGMTDDTLEFAYTGSAWRLLDVGQLWASENPNRIFYRRITALGTPADGTITAKTAEATLADFFVGGSFTSDEGEWTVYTVEGGGEATATSKRRAAAPRIGGSTGRTFSTNGVIRSSLVTIPENVPLAFEGDFGEWDVSTGFSVAADFAVLKRKFNTCDLAVNGKVHVYLHPKLVATTNAAYSNTWEKTVASVKKTFAGAIGPVPVWVDVGVEVPVTLTVEAEATNASVQATIDISRTLDFRWKLSDDEWKQVGSGNTGWVIAKTNFTYEVEGSAGVRASLKPTVTVKVYSLIGAKGWVEPYLEANAKGLVRGHGAQAPDFYYLMSAYAGLNAGVGLELAVWNDDWGTLPAKEFSPLRKQLLYLEGTNTPPTIVAAPEDTAAEAGSPVMLSATAEGTWPLRYAWYHNGTDTGRRESYITLKAGEATAGEYTVVVENGYGTADASANVTVTTNVPVVGTWTFHYQWEGRKPCTYEAEFLADGTMHDTSPSDHWWDWHLNGKTIRIETRERWEGGVGAVYCGTRKGETYMSGTMTSVSGLKGTWSMTRVGAGRGTGGGASVSGAAGVASAGGWNGEEELDPVGFPLAVAVP